MRTLKLTIQYDGTNYHGWQAQKNTSYTIQTIIEKNLRRILRHKVKLIAAGRTDSGVHALMQVAHFKTNSGIDLKKLKLGINSLLPDDIKIAKIEQVSADFHSRYQVKEKTYRYVILNRDYPCVFMRNFEYFYPFPLDIRKMKKAARFLIGRHDFSSFCSNNKKNVRSKHRQIKKINIKRKDSRIYIDITGSGFLYTMVRSIVGTLIEVGRGKILPGQIQHILEKRNRCLAGPTAPAKGLCLLRIDY
ncbi:MAG: tRNA pseudouridine(38-40) synthase TruA [Candidatus Omnitrophica bacterium]|nr:tRNA pseudouridine(38-40) synthase TruA [Candidatus Omnitrophota bacterium]